MLGSACNFSCPHCIQHDFHPRIKKNVEQKVIDWLKKISASRPKDKKPTLILWGGEPLLYREAMKTLVSSLGDSYNYSIISNGSLLTQADVDWINANEISFVYSNDGVNTYATRDKNLFEDEEFLSLFNKIKYRAVDGVFHAFNQKPYEFWDYVESKSPDCPIYLEELLCSQNVPKSYCEFDLTDIKQSFDCMKKDTINAVKTGELKRSVIYLQNYIGGIASSNTKSAFPKCGSCLKSLNVDTAGKIYLCHDQNLVIGTIDDEFEDLYERANIEFTKLREVKLKDKGCFECEVFEYCRGGCPFEPASENQKKTCETRKIAWQTAKDAVCLFNELTKNETA